MAKEKRLKGPYWTRNWIEAMWRFTNENFVDFDSGAVDYEALGREEFQFRKALFFRNFKNSDRAKVAFDTADEDYKRPVENGKKGGRPRKETTADGDTREDSQAKPDGSAITRNETRAHDALGPSANHYGDAATREGAEAFICRESGVAAPTTFSRNMRRVPQNEAPAHGFSGGRTAQGTMSRSPEAAAQSGKAYDQEAYQVSADEARQSRQVSATADALVHQTRAGAGAQALAVRNLPRNKEEVRLFAIDNGLDVDDANDWAEMNLRERHGRDKDGKPIRNWKGAILNYCKAMAAKRETA